jgi:hypothetical protein
MKTLFLALGVTAAWVAPCAAMDLQDLRAMKDSFKNDDWKVGAETNALVTMALEAYPVAWAKKYYAPDSNRALVFGLGREARRLIAQRVPAKDLRRVVVCFAMVKANLRQIQDRLQDFRQLRVEGKEVRWEDFTAKMQALAEDQDLIYAKAHTYVEQLLDKAVEDQVKDLEDLMSEGVRLPLPERPLDLFLEEINQNLRDLPKMSPEAKRVVWGGLILGWLQVINVTTLTRTLGDHDGYYHGNDRRAPKAEQEEKKVP